MSRQQDEYLRLRADGATVLIASAKSRLPIGEARMVEKEIERGELVLPNASDEVANLKSPSPAAGRAAPRKEPEMAKKAKPGDGPTNLTETKDIIRNAVPKIVNLMERRKALNADIAEIRETVNAAGVPKKALDHAIKVKQMDPDVRAAFDEGYAIARDAIGLRMSASLFDMIEEPTEPAPANEDATADAAA